MTSEFDAGNSPRQPSQVHSPMNGNRDYSPESRLDPSQLTASFDTPRDRFELLSAYLDGEVTASERRQVEDWLANDASVQCLYARLLKLRQSMKSLPVPTSNQPVDQTVQQVFSRIEQRPRRAVVWGGMAIAAMFLGALSNGLPNVQPPAVTIAQNSTQTSGGDVSSVALMIPLDRPVIEIPKAAVSTPGATGSALYETGDRVH